MAEHSVDPSGYYKTWGILVYLTCPRPVAILESLVVVGVSTCVAMIRFMEIHLLPRFVPYLVGIGFAFTLLLFILVAPDVMMQSGQNWEKVPVHLEEGH